MHDDPTENKPTGQADPIASARRDLQKALPRRFYRSVAAAAKSGQFVVTLDHRTALTPARQPIAVPTLRLAEALASEWAAQAEFIEPSTMPLTRLVNAAVDGVARESVAIIADIAKYGESDLLFYRAEGPEKLVAAQARAWDPILAASEARLAVRFVRGKGVVFVDQPTAAKAAVRRAVEAAGAGSHGHLRLAALHVMTTLTGSVLIALALAAGETSLAEAWAVAHVDEDYQMSLWGKDQEAVARQALRFEDIAAADRVWRLADTSFS
jgi:chaperone required for assembly of F1-ATPase